MPETPAPVFCFRFMRRARFQSAGGPLSLALACHRQDAASVPARLPAQSDLILTGINWLSALRRELF